MPQKAVPLPRNLKNQRQETANLYSVSAIPLDFQRGPCSACLRPLLQGNTQYEYEDHFCLLFAHVLGLLACNKVEEDSTKLQHLFARHWQLALSLASSFDVMQMRKVELVSSHVLWCPLVFSCLFCCQTFHLQLLDAVGQSRPPVSHVRLTDWSCVRAGSYSSYSSP